jgi:hypothetical protein
MRPILTCVLFVCALLGTNMAFAGEKLPRISGKLKPYNWRAFPAFFV